MPILARGLQALSGASAARAVQCFLGCGLPWGAVIAYKPGLAQTGADAAMRDQNKTDHV